MDELNLFIDYNSKYIVSIIWPRYVLTLHLSHTNCCKSCNASGSCCQFAPTCYVIHLIESYQSSSRIKPFRMLNNGTLILLYFALRTVSIYSHATLCATSTIYSIPFALAKFLVFRKTKDLYLIITQKLIILKSGGFHVKSLVIAPTLHSSN